MTIGAMPLIAEQADVGGLPRPAENFSTPQVFLVKPGVDKNEFLSVAIGFK